TPARARSRQPGDDPAVLLLGERARRLGAHVALRAAGKRNLRRHFVVRRLRDDDRIVAALHEVERLQLAPERLQELPGLLQPAGALLDRLDALIRVLEQRDVGCHVELPSWCGRTIRPLRDMGVTRLPHLYLGRDRQRCRRPWVHARASRDYWFALSEGCEIVLPSYWMLSIQFL